MDSGNPFAPPLNDWWRSTSKHKFSWTSIMYLGTHHALTHCCIPVVRRQCWVQFSQITPVQWTNHELCLDVFQNQFHHLCRAHMFLICQAERCHLHYGCQPTAELSSPSSYKNVFSTHHHQTPTLTGSEFQGWKCSAHINCHTMKFCAWQCFHFQYHCT